MKNENQDPKLEDMLTELDPPYESKEELEIGRLLDQYGMPFFYKQATIIYDQGKNEIWHPTFTLPQYGCAIIDYIDNTDTQSLDQRIQVYRYNQIPATVLGPKDLDKSDFGNDLYQKLKEEIYRFDDPLAYTMTSQGN